MISPNYDTENPYFETCGIRISLTGHNHPDTITIQHSLPSVHHVHFDNLRREGKDCDMQIINGGGIMNVHKRASCILQISSESKLVGVLYQFLRAELSKYSPASDTWTSLKVKRYWSKCILVASGGALFACGSNEYVLGVERYDPWTDT
ncbi:hypothetical protein PRIPAC_89083 [Pristionchus pacificus]|uniref:Uncharacterized protein n=1 Tax=Pristionchus pacificus TaxID=54126 RepID=A0A2A6CYU0_PRIPA|nr:hypothetical protein PRIPAC_89083 [Pristionchus pacificus]|eukprot:PDM83298.1 hypothetical protein PRIPAC_34930 [Pristionchus pacificus]